MPDLTIPEKLLPLVTIPKRFKIVVGGRGSAKSETIAKLCAAGVGKDAMRILAAREHMNSIEDSVHSLLKRIIDRDMSDVPGFDAQASRITHGNGGFITYRGLARNPESLKSMDEIDRVWVEEAQTISQTSLDLLTPSIRAGNSEVWMSGNPGSSKDPFSQRFLKPFQKQLDADGYYEDDLHLIIVINYTDNPWFPPELEAERQYDFLHKSRAAYDHVWLGKYNDTVERAIIQPEWFDACVDAHIKLGIKPRGASVVAHDPSDEGSDNKGLAYRHGVVVLHADELDHGDVNEGMDWAMDYCEEVRPDEFVWDGDGMGVALRRQVTEALQGRNTAITMFRGSMSPEDPDKPYEGEAKKENKENQDVFRNRRAQYYIRLRDRIYKTWQVVNRKAHYDSDDLISFSSQIDKLDLLRAELCRIPTKPTNNGMIQILSKPEMLKVGIESPNMADSVMMLMVNPKLTIDADVNWVPPQVHKQKRSASRYESRR